MFTFNGVSCSTYGIKVRDVQRPPLSEINNKFLDVAGGTGAYFMQQSLGKREIVLDIAVVASTEAQLRSYARSIAKWLLNNGKEGTLVFDDEPTIAYTGVVNSTELTEVLTVGEGTLTFICSKPYAEDVTATASTLATGANTVTVNGTYPTAPVLQLKTGATLSSITVNHYTTRVLTSTFAGKVNNYDALANSNRAYGASATTLPAPSGLENFVGLYDRISALGGTSATNTFTVNGQSAFHMYSFDILRMLETAYGEGVWQGKTLLNDKVTIARSLITTAVCDWYGYGSSVGGNKAWFAWRYTSSNTWATDGGRVTHTSGTVTKLTLGSSVMSAVIDSTGFMHFIAYADPSDGVTASAITTDYIELRLTTKAVSSTFTLTGSVGTNDILIVDNERGKITLNGTLNTQMFSLNSDFITLQNGANVIELPANVTGFLTYKNKWL